MKKMNPFVICAILLTSASVHAAENDVSQIAPYFGSYVLDKEASSKDCSDALAYTIQLQPLSDGSRVSLQSPDFAGFTLDNASGEWDNVYDLNMFFSKDSSTLEGRRAWQIKTMISVFGVEREVKKFLFVDDKEHPFVIATRLSYATFSRGVKLSPDTILCAYRKKE